MTHREDTAAAVLVLAVVIGFLFDRYVLVVGWWPLVGRQWRADRGMGECGDDRDAETGEQCLDCLRYTYDPHSDGCWSCGGSVRQSLDWPERQDEGWDDEPSTDDDADAMIATWRGDEAEHEQLAAVHPIYLDLTDDPDLIVWDAKQQAGRCWEIVHIEFPRLRAELAHMWEAA